MLAPIITFTCDEVWECYPEAARNRAGRPESVQLAGWPAREDFVPALADSAHYEEIAEDFGAALSVREVVTKALEDARDAGVVKKSQEAAVTVTVYEITRNKDKIESENLKSSVEAAKLNDKLYAYPMTADNGYFLYYDSSVVSADQAKKLDDILAAANKANKKVLMDVSDGWYLASFFLGAGCTIGVDENGKQTCNFNNENARVWLFAN